MLSCFHYRFLDKPTIVVNDYIIMCKMPVKVNVSAGMSPPLIVCCMIIYIVMLYA